MERNAAAQQALGTGFVVWLLTGAHAHPSAPDTTGSAAPDPAALQCLEGLDRVIASDTLTSQLLPRASAVVPQLMNMLRDEGYSSADAAQRISRDAALTAEVIRMASGALLRAAGRTPDLANAVSMIGTQGLRRAIARVVLRPLFDARGDSLTARAAPQIWTDSDKTARMCAALSAGRGIDPLDAYLAGLLHNTGWSAALRAIDALPVARLPSLAFAQPQMAQALVLRCDRLFAKLVAPWQLSAPLSALALEIGSNGLDDANTPLATLLKEAKALARLHTQQTLGAVPGGVKPPPGLVKGVEDAYGSLSAA